MAKPDGINFHEIFTFLLQHQWIHDLHMIKFFEQNAWENIPVQWRSAFCRLTVPELNYLPFLEVSSFQPVQGSSPPLPDSLRTFLQQASGFTIQRDQAKEKLPEACVISKELSRGLSPKKLHEVEWMASLVHEVALQAGCNVIVDVGSGLGYLGHLLHNNYGLTVIGLESNRSHNEGSKRRATKQGLNCSGVKSIPFHLNEDKDNIQHFVEIIRDAVKSVDKCQHTLLDSHHPARDHVCNRSESHQQAHDYDVCNRSESHQQARDHDVCNRSESHQQAHDHGVCNRSESHQQACDYDVCNRSESHEQAHDHDVCNRSESHQQAHDYNVCNRSESYHPALDYDVCNRSKSAEPCPDVLNSLLSINHRCQHGCCVNESINHRCQHGCCVNESINHRCQHGCYVNESNDSCKNDLNKSMAECTHDPSSEAAAVLRCVPEDALHIKDAVVAVFRCVPEDALHIKDAVVAQIETNCGSRENAVEGKTGLKDDQLRVCLIGLHCCGDLIPAMLRLYHKIEFIQVMCCVSCCYHKMQLMQDSGHFLNFPMSSAARAGYSAARSLALQDFLSAGSLRLAAQETRSRWSAQSEGDHQRHSRYVGYRAILELLPCNNSDRKSIRQLDYSTFDTFVDSYVSSANMKDGEEQAVRERLHTLHSRFKNLFTYIQPFTCLQVILQPVLESLILWDRQQWLKEHDLAAEIIPVFEEHISPRNLILLSIK